MKSKLLSSGSTDGLETQLNKLLETITEIIELKFSSTVRAYTHHETFGTGNDASYKYEYCALIIYK